jgi:hypothetical protein
MLGVITIKGAAGPKPKTWLNMLDSVSKVAKTISTTTSAFLCFWRVGGSPICPGTITLYIVLVTCHVIMYMLIL